MPKKSSTHDLERFQKIISISRDLASTLDLDILLKRIICAAVELTGAEAASILLYDERMAQLNFQVATNFDPKMRGLEVPVESSIAGWIVTNRSPIIINDTQNDERHFGKISQAIGLTTQSLLGVPLIAKDKVSGVLEAINKQGGEFTDEDQESLMALGSHAAIAIENSRLFQQYDLIAEFVHELRTPLASLRTATHLLTHPKVTDERRAEISESIENEAIRLANMSSDFLNIARLESGRNQLNMGQFEVHALLQSVADLTESLARQKELQFELEIEAGLPTISGDRDKLHQALVNLLSNAIKYNKPGGRVLLKADSAPGGVHLLVSDTGIGIPEKYIWQLFGKFFRVPGSEKHAQGTGLGLSIVKRIVESHGGKISVESESGRGSTFKIFLPESSI
ncbi:MAG: GAF domain-containing protein [Anaerolineae bacterium]|nr:GAF domain-containing protein [Anaerolineae bacterium]